MSNWVAYLALIIAGITAIATATYAQIKIFRKENMMTYEEMINAENDSSNEIHRVSSAK